MGIKEYLECKEDCDATMSYCRILVKTGKCKKRIKKLLEKAI